MKSLEKALDVKEGWRKIRSPDQMKVGPAL